jgi:allantoate deiminase
MFALLSTLCYHASKSVVEIFLKGGLRSNISPVSVKDVSMVNKDRLFGRLQELSKFGRQVLGGITRLAFTEEDREARNLIHTYMEDAGLSVREDAVGNLIGRKEGLTPSASIVMTGSHVDSVFSGGTFDGNLGVLGSIEALKAMQEAGITTEHPIEVCVFRDEEGVRFSFSMIGSKGCAGILRPEDLENKDRAGISLAEAMKANGLDPAKSWQAQRTKNSIKAYVELHIEQGAVLEHENLSVGVVSAITGISWTKIVLRGKAGHAGSTPMYLRHDALAAAAQIISMVEVEATKTGTSVGTVGRLDVSPGGINIIPGVVELTVDVRDARKTVCDALEEHIVRNAKNICQKREVTLEVKSLQHMLPVACSEEIQNAIKAACKNLGLPIFSLPSGATHDGMNLSELCPIGMIFVRSKNGISHNPAEWTSPEDCMDGANVLYHTLLDLAGA